MRFPGSAASRFLQRGRRPARPLLRPGAEGGGRLRSDDRLLPLLRAGGGRSRVSRFIAHGGRMRRLSPAPSSRRRTRPRSRGGESLADVLAATAAGRPVAGTDIVSEHRLGRSACLPVKHERLDVRIGVPIDHLGRPLRRDETNPLLPLQVRGPHRRHGNRVAFIGSDNESAAGWRPTTRASPSPSRGCRRSGTSRAGRSGTGSRRSGTGSPDPGWAVSRPPGRGRRAAGRPR